MRKLDTYILQSSNYYCRIAKLILTSILSNYTLKHVGSFPIVPVASRAGNHCIALYEWMILIRSMTAIRPWPPQHLSSPDHILSISRSVSYYYAKHSSFALCYHRCPTPPLLTPQSSQNNVISIVLKSTWVIALKIYCKVASRTTLSLTGNDVNCNVM